MIAGVQFTSSSENESQYFIFIQFSPCVVFRLLRFQFCPPIAPHFRFFTNSKLLTHLFSRWERINFASQSQELFSRRVAFAHLDSATVARLWSTLMRRIDGIDIEGLDPLPPLDPPRYDLDPVEPRTSAPGDDDFEMQLHEQLKSLPRAHRRYVIEYGYDHNPRAAAARAGLLNPPQSANIDRMLGYFDAHRAAKIAVTADRVVHEVAILAESSLDDYVISDTGQVRPAPGRPPSVMRAIQRIKRSVTIHQDGSQTYTIELQLWNKIEPLRLLGRHVGLFREAVDFQGEVTEIRRIERVIVGGASKALAGSQ